MGSKSGLITLAILAIVASVANSQWSPSGTSNSYVRGCYFTNWAQYRIGKAKYDPSSYIPGLCTHIFYAFVKMDESFQLQQVEWNDLPQEWGDPGNYQRVRNLKKQQPDLKVILSFGGYTWSQANMPLLSRMASTQENRAAFIRSVISYVRKIQYDGLDMDWEYPVAADKANFATLFTEMRAAFEKEAQDTQKPRLLLTAAVAAGISTISAGYDGPKLAQALDLLMVMSYDYHGSWEMVTGFNSPLYDPKGSQLTISNTAAYWVSIGMPKEKVIIGLATYGRGWILSSDDTSIGAPATGPSPDMPLTGQTGVGAFYEICDLIENKDYEDIYRDDYVSALAVGDSYVSWQKGKIWMGYDNVQSFNTKLDWIIANQYGGAFVWTLDYDDFIGDCKSTGGTKYPLLSAIRNKLTGKVSPSDPRPPATRPPTRQPTRPTARPPPTTRGATKASTAKPAPGQPFKCPGVAVQTNPTSCTTFYICTSDGKANTIPCPGGLEFNDVTKACDWKDQAKCTRGQ